MKKINRLILLIIMFSGKIMCAQENDSLWKVWNSKAQPNTNRLMAMDEIVWSYIHTNLDTAAILTFQELNLAKKKQEKKWMGSAYNNLCVIHKNKGDYDLALKYIDTALVINKEIKDKHGIAACYNSMANIYRRKGDLTKALDFNLKSLKIKEELKDSASMAITFGNIAIVYTILDEYDKALIYHFKGLKIKQRMSSKSEIANSLSNIGIIYFKKKEFREGLKYQQQALKLDEEVGDLRGMAADVSNIGLNYKGLKNLDSALASFQKALKINDKVNDKPAVAHSYSNIGSLYLDQKKYKEASVYLEKSLATVHELGELETESEVNYKLYETYKQIGEQGKALMHYEKYTLLKDSVYKEENRKQIMQNQLQYEYDKKATADSVKVAEEKKVTHAQLKQERTQRYALYGWLLLVILFGVFILNRYKISQKQKRIIEIKSKETEEQKTIIEEHQKETIDSINYAKRIQYALLANEKLLRRYLPDHFVLFNPKDIVSGDFYWAAEFDGKFYLAVCDSTGHGVPGAFMSLLNMGFLSEAIKEKNISKPNEILDYVRKRLIESIGGDGQQDGMDAILVCIENRVTNNNENLIYTYAAANNSPVLIRNNTIIELPKDRMPVGKGERTDNFKLHTIDPEKGDALYLYTDGYADQFGGPKGKKFKYKQLNELLLAVSGEESSKQKTGIQNNFLTWKGNLEQVDDVCIVGIFL